VNFILGRSQETEFRIPESFADFPTCVTVGSSSRFRKASKPIDRDNAGSSGF
jgi:hypothetical protein